jgi:glucosamine--fructose-6-phosphate aminotransferase (isomerizing)
VRKQPESLARVIAHQSGPGADALASAADRMRSASSIVITGMGSSLYAAIPLRLHLAQQGLRVALIDASELLHYESALLADSIAVMVSRSGESVEIEKLLERVHPSSVVAVTNEPASTLARNASEMVLVNSFADELCAIQSYTGTLAALALLGMTVFGARDKKWESAVDTLPQALANVIDSPWDWDSFVEGARVIHLLGRGMSRASCWEAALLLAEAAKTAAVPMEAGAFRHGPVELLDQQFRGIVFATDEHTRTLDTALARDLEKLGGRVRVIGPELPAVPPLLQPVLEIIPVQFAAKRLAEVRGIELNQFRYATQVTRSETGFGTHG